VQFTVTSWQFIKNATKLLLQTGSHITQQFSLTKSAISGMFF